MIRSRKNKGRRHQSKSGLPLRIDAIQGVPEMFGDALDHHQAGRLEEAVAGYERVLVLQADHAGAHNNLGAVFSAEGRVQDALTHYERALALKPDDADTRHNLAVALIGQGRVLEAATHFERVLAQCPDHAGAHYSLGNMLAGQGRTVEAVAHYECAVSLKPDYADAHNNLGNALAAQSKSDAAAAHYARALAIDPDHAQAHNNLANILLERGEFDRATWHYGRAIAICPDNAEAYYHRAQIKTFHDADADRAALEALASRHDLPVEKAPFVHFALAKACEDGKDFAGAFAHMRVGNESKRRQIQYDETAVLKGIHRTIAVFDRKLLNRFQGQGDPSKVPIFVLGMPRSGTTLIEQILASHPQIHGAGELIDLTMATQTVLDAAGCGHRYPECIPELDSATLQRMGAAYLARLPALPEGKIRIVDKLPGNFLAIGLIRLILPNARIIHTTRDPVDTCVSCYSKLFRSGQLFSYDLAELGRYYRCYEELMNHWRSVLPPDAMLDVSYEGVVGDLEGHARRLIGYCGLPWDDRCLSFHETNRPVKTASAAQVRQPVFRTSLQRWRKYEGGLGPLLQALGMGGQAAHAAGPQ